jgi:hypothetical protein
MARTAETETPNFESALDTPGNLIERPKPLPQGSYITILVGQPRIGLSSKKQTEFSEFTHKIVSAQDDVDEDKLEEYLTDPEGEKKSLADVAVKNTYYHTKASLYRLKEFCIHLGIDVEEGTPRQWLMETPGCEVGIHIRHEPWDNGEGVSARVDRTFPVKG